MSSALLYMYRIDAVEDEAVDSGHGIARIGHEHECFLRLMNFFGPRVAQISNQQLCCSTPCVFKALFGSLCLHFLHFYSSGI